MWIPRLFESWQLKKPYALEWEEWEVWHKRNKSQYPIKYFLQESVSSFVNRIKGRINDTKWSVYHRTTRRYDIIKIKTLKKQYWDKDTQMVHACFQLLTDFVEKELGARNLGESRYKIGDEGRKAGLEYLDWEINDPSTKNTPQGVSAKEKKELYLWWHDTRLKRVEPWSDETIWRDAKSIMEGIPMSKYRLPENASKYKIWSEAVLKTEELERKYDEEDNEMLSGLVKIRKSLWS